MQDATGATIADQSVFNCWCYYFFRLGVWASALPAADFDFALDRPSCRTFEAALAAFEEVCFLGER